MKFLYIFFNFVFYICTLRNDHNDVIPYIVVNLVILYYYMFTYTYIAVKKHGQTSAKNDRISLLCTVNFVYQLADLFVIWKIRKLEKKSVIRYLFLHDYLLKTIYIYHFAFYSPYSPAQNPFNLSFGVYFFRYSKLVIKTCLSCKED